MAEAGRPPSSRIFISYRREDSSGFVRALLPPLRESFGGDRIFKDTDNIPPGQDFAKVIQGELDSCGVLLAVIGTKWATAEDPRTKKRRLENPHDYLRLEIATALKNEHVVVIPVLVDLASMPSAEDLPEDLEPLARRNAIELSDSRWDTDVQRLIRAIEGLCQVPASPKTKRVEPPPPEAVRPAEPPPADAGGGGFELLEAKRKRQIVEHVKAARQALELQDFEAVLVACERAIWLDPQEHEARDLCARARAAIDEQKIQKLLAQAQQALATGDLAGASEAIDEALACSPNHAGAMKLRQGLLRTRQERERQREVERIVAAELKNARASFDEEDFEAALNHVEDALALAPESSDARELQARIVAARDEQRRLRELKRRAQQTVTEAKAEFAAGNHDAAVSRLERFTPPHELVTRALEDLGRRAAEAKENARLAKAKQGAADAAAQIRRDVDAMLAKAGELFRQKDFLAAREVVEAGRGLDATHPEVAGWAKKISDAIADEAAVRERAKREKEEHAERVEADRIAREEQEARADRDRRAREFQQQDRDRARDRQQHEELERQRLQEIAGRSAGPEAAVLARKKEVGVQPPVAVSTSKSQAVPLAAAAAVLVALMAGGWWALGRTPAVEEQQAVTPPPGTAVTPAPTEPAPPPAPDASALATEPTAAPAAPGPPVAKPDDGAKVPSVPSRAGGGPVVAGPADSTPGRGTVDGRLTRGAELADQYTRAKNALDTAAFSSAITLFEEIQRNEPNYRDVPAQLTRAREGLNTAARQAMDNGTKLEDSDDLPGALQQYERGRGIDQSMAAAFDQSIARVKARMKTEGTDAFTRGKQYDALDRVEQAITWFERAYRNLADDDPNKRIAKDRLDALRARK